MTKAVWLLLPVTIILGVGLAAADETPRELQCNYGPKVDPNTSIAMRAGKIAWDMIVKVYDLPQDKPRSFVVCKEDDFLRVDFRFDGSFGPYMDLDAKTLQVINPPDFAARKQCIERGGLYDRGPFGEWGCEVPYSDGGRACSEDSQCKGGCIFEFGNGGPEPKPGDLVKGICQRSDRQFGCFSQVRNGRLVDRGICVD